MELQNIYLYHKYYWGYAGKCSTSMETIRKRGRTEGNLQVVYKNHKEITLFSIRFSLKKRAWAVKSPLGTAVIYKSSI